MYIFKIIKNTFYKKVIYKKIYLQILYFELLGIEKNMYTYLFKNYLQKSVYNWLITKTLYTHVLLWFIILRSTIVCRAILSLGEHQWMVTTSSLLKKYKKWRVSFSKKNEGLVLGRLKSFKWVHSHLHTHPKKQFDLQSYSYCPFSIGKLMWWWWWFVGSLLKTWHWSVWGGEVADNVQI